MLKIRRYQYYTEYGAKALLFYNNSIVKLGFDNDKMRITKILWRRSCRFWIIFSMSLRSTQSEVSIKSYDKFSELISRLTILPIERAKLQPWKWVHAHMTWNTIQMVRFTLWHTKCKLDKLSSHFASAKCHPNMLLQYKYQFLTWFWKC